MNRRRLLARIGEMRHVAGIDSVEAIDGPERGVRMACVRTGSGPTYRSFDSPSGNYNEQIFNHDVRKKPDGTAEAMLVNHHLEFAVRIRYAKAALPHLAEWNQLGEGEYVVGIEPGTCSVLGREMEKRSGRVVHLEPGRQYIAGLEIECLHRQAAVAKVVTS